MTQPIRLQATGLQKSYKGKLALQGVSLSLCEGEVCALVGPNGAGKSTLLQLLTGLFNPDQGSVVIMGHSMQTHPSQALASLGVVFQQTALDLDLPVISNLLFHTDLHGFPRVQARKRIFEDLAEAGLSEHTHATVRTLSGGTQRKVELVRALLHRPQVLLLDEATAGLDPASRRHLSDTVRKLCRTHRTAVLWATHLIEEAQSADRLLLLHQGSLRYNGTPAQFMQEAKGDDFHEMVVQRLESVAA